MGNLEPRQAAICTLSHAATRRDVTGDMPRSVVEVTGITGAKFVAEDDGTIQPELSKQHNVRASVCEISAVGHFEFGRSAFHWQ
jgi:hypothetical protein